MTVLAWLGHYKKATLATLIAFFASLGVALSDGAVSGVEWTTIAVATLVAAGGVSTVTNTPRPARSPRTNVRRDRGDDLPGGAG